MLCALWVVFEQFGDFVRPYRFKRQLFKVLLCEGHLEEQFKIGLVGDG